MRRVLVHETCYKDSQVRYLQDCVRQMRGLTKNKIGFVLVVIALLVAGVVLVNVRVEQTGENQEQRTGDWRFKVTRQQVKLDRRLLLPPLALFAVGVACLVWPTRKPPMLSS